MADNTFKTWLQESTTAASVLLGSALLSLSIWIFGQIYSQNTKRLDSMDLKFEVLTKDIVVIKLNDSANTITINNMKNDIESLKQVDKEYAKSIGELQRSSAQHEQQLRQLNK